MSKAILITEVTVIDPQSGGCVEVTIFKDPESGGMFGIDSSFLEQNFEDDEDVCVKNPFATHQTSSGLIELDFTMVNEHNGVLLEHLTTKIERKQSND